MYQQVINKLAEMTSPGQQGQNESCWGRINRFMAVSGGLHLVPVLVILMKQPACVVSAQIYIHFEFILFYIHSTIRLFLAP